MRVREYIAHELPNPLVGFFRTNGMAHGSSILYPTVVAPRTTIVATAFSSNVVHAHGPTTFCTPHHAAGKLPYLIAGIGDPLIILYGFPCSNDPFFRDTGIRNRDRYPFFPWGRYAPLDSLVARCAVRGALGKRRRSLCPEPPRESRSRSQNPCVNRQCLPVCPPPAEPGRPRTCCCQCRRRAPTGEEELYCTVITSSTSSLGAQCREFCLPDDLSSIHCTGADCPLAPLCGIDVCPPQGVCDTTPCAVPSP
jgi:hypothetical protein